jgi:hypothetical protein
VGQSVKVRLALLPWADSARTFALRRLATHQGVRVVHPDWLRLSCSDGKKLPEDKFLIVKDQVRGEWCDYLCIILNFFFLLLRVLAARRR